MDRSQQILNNC